MCYPKFKLFVQGIGNEEWGLWSEIQDEFNLEGSISFYEWSTYVDITLSPADVDLLTELYWNADTESASIHFRTAVVIPGSQVMGPETDVDELTHNDWNLRLVSREKVLTCADSNTFQNDLTVNGDWRGSSIQYEDQPAGTTPIEPIVVPLR
jgi:hypothetical protein